MGLVGGGINVSLGRETVTLEGIGKYKRDVIDSGAGTNSAKRPTGEGDLVTRLPNHRHDR